MNELTDADVGLTNQPELTDAQVGLLPFSNPKELSDADVGLVPKNAPQAQISAPDLSSNIPAQPALSADVQPTALPANPDLIKPAPSIIGAVGRTALRDAAPTLAGVAAAPIGGTLGRFAGAAAGARGGALLGALVPGLGETGISEGIGAVIGGLVGGIGSFIATQKAAKVVEQGAADEISPSASNPFSSASESQDVAAHPLAAELTDLALMGKPNPFNLVRAARTITTDSGQAALKDLFTTGASADGYKTWQATTDAATQKAVMNVLNVAQNGGINAVFNAADQIRSGDYSVPQLLKSAAEGALFNEPWIHAKNPATDAFDSAVAPKPTDQPQPVPAEPAPIKNQPPAAVQQSAPTTIIKGIVATPVDADTHVVSVNGKDAAILKYVDADGLNAAQQSVGATGWDGYFVKNDPQTQQPTIYINRQYMDSENPIFTHETTHLLDAMGLVTPEQKAGVVEKYGKDVEPEVIQRYTQFNQENNLPAPTPQQIQDETFANIFQGWHKNDNAPKVTWIQRAINFVRGIVGLGKTGEQHAQDILAGKFKEPTTAGAVTSAPSVPPEEITKPDPNWRVTVQPNEMVDGKELPTGYVQIDSVKDGQNQWSSSPEKLAQKGIQVPDFSKLPKGQYTYAEAVRALDRIQPLNSSTQFSAANHEDMTPEEKLSASPKVAVKLPSGATHLRVTDSTGKSETIPANKFNAENPVAGRDVKKAIPVAIKTSGIYKGSTIPVKGAVDINPQFSVAKKEIEPEKNPIFKDNILDALKSWQAKGTPQQLLAHLAKFRGTKDQADWIGLDDFLKGKTSVTKSDVEDFVRANQVDIKEVTNGAPETNVPSWYIAYKNGPTLGGSYESESAAAIELNDTFPNRSDLEIRRGIAATNEGIESRASHQTQPTKFSNYQTPGGSNYRELLLTLPEKENQPSVWNVTAPDGSRVRQFNTEAEAKSEVSKNGGTIKPIYLTTKTQKNFTSSHFDEPNILGHIRFNERESTTAENQTPERTMHLEELQSDWHQKGRKEGYGTPENMPSSFEVRPVEGAWSVFDNFGRVWASAAKEGRANEIALDYNSKVKSGNLDPRFANPGVPDAPFKTSWPMLLFKRALRYAVDNGFKRVTWTTGDQQNDRYDLSKQVKKILAIKFDDGTFEIKGTDLNGEGFGIGTYKASELEGVVGKELAEKIINQETQNAVYAGNDLKIGGEGMRGFYDKILPSEVNKFVKRYGAKVGEADIGVENRRVFQRDEPSVVTRKDAMDKIKSIRATWELPGRTPEGWQNWNTALDAQAEKVINEMGSGASYAKAMEQFGSKQLAEKLGFGGVFVQEPATDKVHSLDITPELQKSAADGLPMFSVAKKPAKYQIETPEFKRWFGDSKVVDENGNPMVVYHGSNSDFTQFDKENASVKTFNPNAQLGFFFTKSRAEANRYTKDWGDKNGVVYPAYVSLKNPYEMPYVEFDKLAMGIFTAPGETPTARSIAAREIARSRRDELASEGYDGIIVNAGKPTEEIVAFEPTQIKSAIGNSGAFDPSNPDIRFSVAKDRKRAQVGGIPEVGQERDTESISDNQAHIRERLFDGTKAVSDENTSSAWQVFDEMTGKSRSQIAGQLKDAFGGSRLLLGLYKGEVWKYARKLAIHGDDSLLRAMYDHSEQFETLAGGGASTAGSALRAEAENSNDPVNRALQSAYETERENAANSASGIDRETFTNLLKRLRDLKLSPDEVEKVVKEGKLPDGKTLEEALEELTPESKEAMSMLDKYERSQTEWLKPDVKKSIIRIIVDAAIGENKLARYGEKDFLERLSGRLQEATVPRDISDRLAFEVWKDKAAREATKTDRAVKADAAFEQKRAQAILDKLQTDQTEVFSKERRSKVADLVKAFYKNPAASDEVRAQQIAKLEKDLVAETVNPSTAKELAREAGQRKLVLEANDRLAVEKVTANEAQKVTERELKKFEEKNSGVEWLKEPGKRDLVLKAISDALKSKSPILDDPIPVINGTKSVLTGLGVDDATAGNLAYEIETIRRTQFANRRVKVMQSAANSKNIRSLIESILETPYRAQSDPKWLHETSVRWFESNGLGKEQAEAAARLFENQFKEALANASNRVAKSVLDKKVTPKTYEDLQKLIRAGVFDPNKNWIDVLAQKNGWKKPTSEQLKKLQELEHKSSSPELSPEEVADLKEQQLHVVMHFGKRDGITARAIGESFTASLLSGIRTLTVQLSPMVMNLRDLAIASASDPANAMNYAKAMYRAFKENAISAFKYAWTKDAYGFHLNELEHGFNELKRISDETDSVVKSKTASPQSKAVAYAKKVFALQRYVFRNLNSLDQASMAVTREWKLAYYSAQAFKMAGLNPKNVAELIDSMEMMRRNEFEKAVQSGLDKNTAQVRANSRVESAVWDFVNNATGKSELADQVLKASENDIYSTVGRVPKGLTSLDEGFLTRFTGFNHFLQFVSKIRSESGLHNIAATSLVGMINIPFRTTRYFSDFSPYGLLRYGIYKYRQNRGLENYWKQTYGNALQARARLYSALAGTVAMGAFTAWAAHSSTSDDKAGDEDFGMYITGRGPDNKVLADAWAKRGFKQYSMNFVIGGRIVSIPLTRAGEALLYPFIVPAALDDYAWKVKEAAASGHPIKSPVSSATASLIGEALSMTGQSGILQTFGQLQEATQNGGSLAKAAVKVGVSAVSSTVLPFRQLLASVSDMFFGSMDQSSISALIANQFPIVGLPFQTPAVNRFGDPLYDRSWYGIIARTGVPIAFQVDKTPENERLYTTLVDKGASPPPLNRSDLESKYGELTDAQFKQFATISGQTLKASMQSNLAAIQGMSPEDAKKLLLKLANQANGVAVANLGLGGSGGQAASGNVASASGGTAQQQKKTRKSSPRAKRVTASFYNSRIKPVKTAKSSKTKRPEAGSLYGLQPRHLYGA